MTPSSYSTMDLRKARAIVQRVASVCGVSEDDLTSKFGRQRNMRSPHRIVMLALRMATTRNAAAAYLRLAVSSVTYATKHATPIEVAVARAVAEGGDAWSEHTEAAVKTMIAAAEFARPSGSRKPARHDDRRHRNVGGGDWDALPDVKHPGTAGRPETRADCVDGPRPCPWVSCRHHLLLDLTPKGEIILNHHGTDLGQLADTCALDVADRGGSVLEIVSDRLNLTRERVRQIEEKALLKIRRHGGDRLHVPPEQPPGNDQ